jgi:hypothetical protein
VGDGVIGKTVERVAHDDLLVEINAEPFGRGIVLLREGKFPGRDVPAIARRGQLHGTKIGREFRANRKYRWSALAVYPTVVDGIESPGAIQFQASGRTDPRFGHGHGIERLDRMETYIRETWLDRQGTHLRSLAE